MLDKALKKFGIDPEANNKNDNPIENTPKSTVGDKSLLNEEKVAKKPNKMDKLKKKVDSMLGKNKKP